MIQEYFLFELMAHASDRIIRQIVKVLELQVKDDIDMTYEVRNT